MHNIFFVIGVFLYRLTDSSLSLVINSSSFMQSLPVSQSPKLCIQSVNYMYNVASAIFDSWIIFCHHVMCLKMASTVLTVESLDNSDSSDDLTSTDEPPVGNVCFRMVERQCRRFAQLVLCSKKGDPNSTIIWCSRGEFLSLLNSSFRDSQEKAFKDYVEGSIMLQYNEY